MKNKIKMLFNSLIGRLFISHIIIIIIVCISNYLSHSFIYNILEERLIKDNKNEFSNIVKDCEDYISDIKNHLIYIDMDNNFQKIITGKNISDYSIYKLSIYMQSKYIESPKYITSWVYHENTDYIITNLASYPKKMFWEKLYYSPEHNYKFWEDQAKINTQFVIYPSEIYSDNSIVYTRNINNSSKDNKYLTIIYKSLNNNPYYLCAFVDMNKFLAGNNSVLAEKINITVNSDKEKYIVIDKNDGIYTLSSYSTKNNLHYYMDLDYRGIKQNLDNVNIKFTAITVLAIILSLLFSLFFSIKINMPLKNIGKIILSDQTDKNATISFIDLETIRKHIYSLIQSNMKYKSEIETRDMRLQSYIFLDKIRNLYTPNANEISSSLKFSFINGFYMICIRIHLINSINIDPAKKSAIFYDYNQKLNKYFSANNKDKWNCVYFSENQENFVLLLETKDQGLNESVNQIKDYLELIEEEGICFTILVSELQKDLNYLDSVYGNILILQQKRSLGKETQVIYQNSIARENNHYILSAGEIKDFINSISNGYIKESIELMECVLKNNYKRKISCFQFTILCYEFINLCIKAVIDIYSYLPEDIDVIRVYSTLKLFVCYEDYREICKNFINEIANYIVKTETSNDYIIDYILKHIQEKYYEDIYLDLFAQKLNVSRVYICKHFKEKMGINLLDYLNKYRMEVACDKLKNTDLRIKDIANEVGIENVNSFIRIFKKYYGKSPGEYRIYSVIID